MPARLFNHAVPPQRIRTLLVLFALALTLPLVGLAVFALQQMATLEEREIERRVLEKPLTEQRLRLGLSRIGPQ
jgi:hypothetical protein